MDVNMNTRTHRLSDLISWVCVPVTLFLYLHLVLTPTDPLITTTTTTTTTSVRKVPPPLNVTSLARPDLLLVTPILRSASTTLMHLLKLLAPRRAFTYTPKQRKRAEFVHIPDEEMQEGIVRNLSLAATPAAYMESFAFINFTRYNYVQPIQVAVVRDPVERAISRYYHARAPFALVERQQLYPGARLPSRNYLKKDLESCMTNPRDPECKYVSGRTALGHTIEFFCGHIEYCPVFGERAGLAAAKEVVERGWAVVGVLEDWNKTLEVLEAYVPRFFTGATQLYYEHIEPSKTLRNENFYKPRVEEAARQALKKVFDVEYEFYEFVKQRLHLQHRALSTGRM